MLNKLHKVKINVFFIVFTSAKMDILLNYWYLYNKSYESHKYQGKVISLQKIKLKRMGHHQLDSLDEQILRLIASNARIPFLEVARACNVSGAAIHQRIQKLTNLGILKGSEYVIDPEKIGYETCAYIGLYLKDPEQFDSVTEALKNIS